MKPFATIVAAVDFSDTSRDVVQAALALARDGDGRVCLIHAVPHAIRTPWVVDASGVDIGDLQCQWVAEAETQLVELAATLRLDPRRVSLDVVVGPAASEILRHADERGADLLVLGSHGHGVIRRFLLGSVAERVLREAGCPVMIVPDRVFRATAVEALALRGAGSGNVA